MNWAAVSEIAGLELRVGLRNRWGWLFGILFGFSALAISLAGGLAGGRLQVDPFPRVAVSLLHLSLYTVPLAGLLVGIFSFSADNGHWDLLLSQPISRLEIVIGKTFGLLRALILSILTGFGLAGLFVASVSPAAWPRYLALTAAVSGLALDFLALGVLLAVVGRRRPVAMALGVVVWFVLVIGYDLLVAGTVLLTRGGITFGVLLALLAANPVDITRTLGLLATGTFNLLGPAGALLLRLAGGQAIAVLAAMMCFWATGLLAATVTIFCRQDA